MEFSSRKDILHRFRHRITSFLLTIFAAALIPVGCGGSSGSTTRTAIVTQPVSSTVASGMPATIAVQATGSGTLTYQWFKSGTAIPGATQQSLYIPSVDTLQTGVYYVVITGSAGTVTSNSVTISTTSPAAPHITLQPVSVNANLGVTTSFLVNASGNAVLTYQWYKGSTAISGATAASYIIIGVTAADAGDYYVIVTNDSGAATSDIATLQLGSSAPTIQIQPVSVTVSTNAAASLFVTASGSPTLTYQWFKDSIAVAGAHTARLDFSAATAADAGVYYVIITNGFGSKRSNNATLNVNSGAPVITQQPRSIAVQSFTRAVFTVVATGAPTLTYQWYKDLTAIDGATTAILTIPSVTNFSAGSYRVRVANGVGSVTSSPATLSVLAGSSGIYTQSGGTVTKTSQSYSSTLADETTVSVTNAGTFNLSSSTVTKSGNTSSTDNSSWYGQNSAVLATSASSIVLSSVTINTSGLGANGLFAYGTSSNIQSASGVITTTADYSSGAAASTNGIVGLNNTNITTSGQHSAALSSNLSGGVITTTGGTFSTSGLNSPVIRSVGTVSSTGATMTASASEGAVIDGKNTISLGTTSLTGATHGIRVMKTATGTVASTATIGLSGGSITAHGGDGIYVDGTNSETLVATFQNGVTITASTGNIMNVVNSGVAACNTSGVNLVGNFVAEALSTLDLSMTTSSTFNGTLTNVGLTLDGTCTWTVAANSTTTVLVGAIISGTTITNITGNGHTVYYSKALSSNSYLGGLSYTLVGGGTLIGQ